MLWDLFLKNDERIIHKWKYFFPVYERWFKEYQNKSIVFFEIGVSRGGSMSLWSQYFGPLATIVGIDIDEECRVLEDKFCKVRIGSQSDTVFLQSLVDEFGCPDIVLDDGSHQQKDMRATFDFLFPRLQNNGVYLVEDMHTCYWEKFGGGLKRDGSFLEYCKDMIDSLNAQHIQEEYAAHEDIYNTCFSINFYDSMCVFEKKKRPGPNSALKTGGEVTKEESVAKKVTRYLPFSR